MIRSALLAAAVLALPVLAEDTCPCGKAEGQCTKAEACTCGAGQCPLHQGKGKHGMKGMHGLQPMHAMPTFDARTVTTFTAKVTEIEREAHGNGMVGVHLVVRLGDERVVVHLGPASWVDPKATFAVGDQVEVTGSRITLAGQPVVLSTRVKRGALVLEPRAADGTPNFKRPATGG